MHRSARPSADRQRGRADDVPTVAVVAGEGSACDDNALTSAAGDVIAQEDRQFERNRFELASTKTERDCNTSARHSAPSLPALFAGRRAQFRTDRQSNEAAQTPEVDSASDEQQANAGQRTQRISALAALLVCLSTDPQSRLTMSLLRAASNVRRIPLLWQARSNSVIIYTRRFCHSACRLTAAAPPPSSPSAPPSTLLLVDAMGLAFRQYFGYKNRYTPLVATVPDSLGVPAAPAAPVASSDAAASPATSSPSTAADAAAPPGTTVRDVGALYGYASSLLNLCFLLQPTHVAACMDLGNRSSFRHALFPDYKSERKPVEDALKWQLTQLARVNRALGIQPITARGFEADDVIGTLARLASSSSPATSASSSAASSSASASASTTVSASGAGSASPSAAAAASPLFDRVIILSNDKDFIQCLNDRVSILSPKTGAAASVSSPSSSPSAAGNGPAYVFLHHSEVSSVLGVPPSRFVEYLVLVGDVVDGIPGVAGVGPVRAKAILEAYPSLEACVADCVATGGRAMAGGKKPTKSGAKVVESLLASASQLELWRELATIRTDVPDLPCAATNTTANATDSAVAAAAGADSAIPAAAAAAVSAVAASAATAASPRWSHLAYHGPVAASSDEVEAITPEQQAVADSIHDLWREFNFPPPPHFVDEPSTAAEAAKDTGGLDGSLPSDSEPATASASALPRLLSQAEWAELESIVEARAKSKVSRSKKVSASTATTAVFAASTAESTTVEVVATRTQTTVVSMQAKQR